MAREAALSPQATKICEYVTRLDDDMPWNVEDAEVLLALIDGLHWSGDMRALLHGIAAGILAQCLRTHHPNEEQA